MCDQEGSESDMRRTLRVLCSILPAILGPTSQFPLMDQVAFVRNVKGIVS